MVKNLTLRQSQRNVQKQFVFDYGQYSEFIYK